MVVWEEAEHLARRLAGKLQFNEAYEDLLGKIVIPRMKESGIALTIPLIFTPLENTNKIFSSVMDKVSTETKRHSLTGSDEKIIGIIHLSNKTTKEMWTSEDLRSLNKLGETVTTALINSIEHGAMKKLYQVRNRREKIMSLAELTAGICHQFRNLVSSSNTFFQLFTGDAENINDLLEFKKVAQNDIARILNIIDEVQKFSDAEINISHIETNVNEVLNKMVSSIDTEENGFKPFFTLALDKNLPCILGDAGALLYVFKAIGVNAVEAMEKSQEKKLLIRSRLVNVANEKFYINRKQRSCQVEITDTGEGIKAEDIPKIFNPLHTTKHMHIGLSLAICHKIIEAHGGYIEIKSWEGKGTSFFVNLPMDYKPKQEDAAEEKNAHSDGKKVYMGG